MNRISYLLTLMLLITGCAFGQTQSYHQVQLDLHYKGDLQVAAITIDRRSYVISGDKPPDFVGLQRGGFGNPFDVATASGNALVQDMTTVVVQSLSSQGFKVTPVIMPPVTTHRAVRESLERDPPDRLLLITVREWKSDTLYRTALLYDLDFQVFDAAGKMLASKTNIAGRDDLGGSFWNPPGYASGAVPIAFQRLFERQLNDPEISGALR